ncbi:MAG: nucleotidyltransferase [Eubacteriales bacterium]
MNVVGVVTEHNPFHNGHLYHIEQAREKCDAELVVSVMSGHFLQRGEPALFNKWARAKMAVLSGVDMVIELPTAFSVRSASAFAAGSVSLLNSMGIVTHICFGTEAGDAGKLWPAARLLANEPAEFKAILSGFLDEGLSFPAARAGAVERYFADEGQNTAEPGLYASPNNILGIEYLRALLNTGSNIKPVAIKRFSAGYHDTEIGRTNAIASATSIREELLSGGRLTDTIKTVVPGSAYEEMANEISHGLGPVFIENYGNILFYLLRTMPPEQVAGLYDVTEGLENRILEASKSASSVKDLLKKLKTKRYTWTRIQRILTYVLLGYTKSLAGAFDYTGPRYLRILGLSSRGRALLKTVKKQASLPVIIRTAPWLRKYDDISSMLRFDAMATDIYALLYPGHRIHPVGWDYRIMPFACR